MRQLALGWALGHVLEIAAFMLTAATGTRGLFAVYPLCVGAAALATMARRRRASPISRQDRRGSPVTGVSRRLAWLAAAVCSLAMVYTAFAYFDPLPGTESVRYDQDHTWHVSLAADLKHHWPLEDPNVSGEPLPYHYFVHVHMAAASATTNVDVSLIYLRLFILPLVVLLALLFIIAGQSLASSPYAGLIAAGLTLLTGQLTLDFTTSLRGTAFLGFFFNLMVSSPSFLFGLVVLVALITLLAERITLENARGSPGDWILIALLALGASGAKVTILPILLAALIFYAICLALARRPIPVTVWGAAGLILALVGATTFSSTRGIRAVSRLMRPQVLTFSAACPRWR